jgi:phosphoserine phosphatase
MGIAKGIGRVERMSELEAGHILTDVERGPAEIGSWYLPLGRAVVESHLASLTIAPGADEGCELLREAGVDFGLVSVTWKFAVELFAARFGASSVAATGLDWRTGEVDRFGPDDKAPWLTAYMATHELEAIQVAAVGDSPADLAMLRAAGVGYYVGEPDPDIESVIHQPNADIRELAAEILDL